MKKAIACTVVIVALLYGLSFVKFSIGDQPPELVGAWGGMRQGTLWEVVMGADGHLKAGALIGGRPPRRDGKWGAKDGKLNWLFADPPSPLKEMLWGADESFEYRIIDKNTLELLEPDGSRVRLQRAGPGGVTLPK